MNARMLIPSKYFSPADFEGEVTVTIERVEFTDLEVEGKGGKQATTETRGALILKEFPSKPWVCNVTNTKCLIAMFGEEHAEKNWPGKRVRVYQERVMSFGEWVLGVRIRGSPDLAAPVSVNLKLRKKKQQTLTMQVTGGAATPPPSSSVPPVQEPPRVRMWTAWKASGHTDGPAFWALVRKATGHTEAQLVDGDVAKFEAAMRAANEPPPPISEEEAQAILATERAAGSPAPS